MDTLLKFYSPDKIKIPSSKSKYNLGRSGKGLITSLGLKSKTRPKKCKKARDDIEMSGRRTFQRLLGNLTSYLIRVMRGGGPNMSLLTVNFI